jgi:hypothetical protein
VKSSLLVPLVLVTVACGSVPETGSTIPDETEPVIATEREHYRPGQVATLSLSNPLDERIGYNACAWTLELHRDDGWETAPYEDERVCTMELRILEPGGAASPTFAFDDSLPAGSYRFRAILHRLDTGSRKIHRSGTFRIRR